MTAAFQPLPSRDDGDDLDADRRAYLETIPTAELVLPGTAPAGVNTAPLAAPPSIDAADLATLEMVPPHIEASIPWQLLSFAEKHQDDAEADRREARRFRIEADDMERNLESLRDVSRRYVARRNEFLAYAQSRTLNGAEQQALTYIESCVMQIDQRIADLRACLITTRQGARRLETQAVVRDGLAERCRRAARAESGANNTQAQGRA